MATKRKRTAKKKNNDKKTYYASFALIIIILLIITVFQLGLVGEYTDAVFNFFLAQAATLHTSCYCSRVSIWRHI
jgi:hypothetical protein